MDPVTAQDRSEAERFLHLLEPGGDFWYQTLREPKSEGNTAPQKFHGSLAEVWDRLAQINSQGSAAWVQINAGLGRSNADVDRIRAYFVDLDGVSAEPLFSSALEADIIVESSPGKFHGYWLTGNAPLEAYAKRMHALADKFGGDHAVCHLARVMRLPGLIHWKNDPFVSRIVKVRQGL